MTEQLTYTVKAYDWATKRTHTEVCANYSVASRTAHGLGHQTKVVGFNRRVVRAVASREVAIFHSGREVARYIGGTLVTESTLAECRYQAQNPPHQLDAETVAALIEDAKAAEASFKAREFYDEAHGTDGVGPAPEPTRRPGPVTESATLIDEEARFEEEEACS